MSMVDVIGFSFVNKISLFFLFCSSLVCVFEAAMRAINHNVLSLSFQLPISSIPAYVLPYVMD